MVRVGLTCVSTSCGPPWGTHGNCGRPAFVSRSFVSCRGKCGGGGSALAAGEPITFAAFDCGAAQREGMRRWATRADGCCWQLLTTQEVEERCEFTHEGLQALLTTKQILSAGEWRKLGISNLRVGHYVRVGQGATEAFYGPVEVASQHTLSGRVAEDVGDVLEIEIAPRWNPQGPVRDGIEADDGGRWAVRSIRAVRRHEGRRGRPLDVLVEWEGEETGRGSLGGIL
jgi:hypothetical protein